MNHQELAAGGNYIFFHIGNNNKKGRIYFTKGIKIDGRKTMFLITLYNNVEEDTLIDEVNKISNTFEGLLAESGLNIERNY